MFIEILDIHHHTIMLTEEFLSRDLITRYKVPEIICSIVDSYLPTTIKDMNITVIYKFQRIHPGYYCWENPRSTIDVVKLTFEKDSDFEMPTGTYECCTLTDKCTALTAKHFDKPCETVNSEHETFIDYVINRTIINANLTIKEIKRHMTYHDTLELNNIVS